MLSIEESPEVIWAGCDRFLGGPPAGRPTAVLADLAETAADVVSGDHYGSGDVIARFEAEVADLLGKEAVVFMPSGTMTQQIALRIWSDRTGIDTVAFHPMAHLETHEEKAYHMLHGLHALLVGEQNRLLTLEDLQAVREPVGTLLLELPQRDIGGQLPVWEDLTAQVSWARERGVRVHMDGARLWESAPFYGRSYAAISSLFDSVYVSFYKTLDALAGAALAGPADVISEARVWRRRHGGDLFQFYPYVISARSAFQRTLPHVEEYVAEARALAEGLQGVAGLKILPDPPQTNMMHLFLEGERKSLEARALEIARRERVILFRRLSDADVPGWCRTEISVRGQEGRLTPPEARQYLEEVLSRDLSDRA